MGEIAAAEIILITDLTFVINLQTSKASSYLNFMGDSKMFRKQPGGPSIVSEKIRNNYLVVRAPSSIFKFDVVQNICDSLIKHKMDFIAIDELFPENNRMLLNIKEQPIPKWVIDRIFNSVESFIKVK